MEKILYEYCFNITEFFENFIPLIIGVVFLCNSIVMIKSKSTEKGWGRFVSCLLKIIGFVVGPLGIGLFLLLTIGMFTDHAEYKEMLANDDVQVVEGYVEDFYPMPYEGHDTEHFEINGIYFEYSDYIAMSGYHTSASHGGVITENGQHLKIKYITEEFGEETQNIILYIAEME